MSNKAIKIIYWLIWMTLLVPLIYWQGLQYPFVTTKTIVFQILAELVLPFYLYLILKNSKLRPELRNWLNISVLFYFFVNFIAALLGTNLSQSFWGTPERMSGVFNLAHLVLLYFYFLLLFAAAPKYFQRFIRLAVWVSAVTAFYGLYTRFGFPALFKELFPPRSSSVLGNPIYFSAFLILPFFLSLYLAYTKQTLKARIFYLAIASLDLGGIYVSGTRAAYMGLAVGALLAIIVWLILAENRKVKIYGLAILLVMLVAGGVALRSLRFTDADSKSRLIQWEVALSGAKVHPLLGVGPENYYVVANSFFNPAIYTYDSSWWDKPHNSFLEILTTTGTIGLLAYLVLNVIVIGTLWSGYKKGRIKPAVLGILIGALAAYQVQNFFAFDTQAASIVWFLYLAVANYLGKENVELYNTDTEIAGKNLRNKTVVGLVGLGVFSLIYYANIQTLRSSYQVNSGKNMQPRYPISAKTDLDRAASLAVGIARKGDIAGLFAQYTTINVNNDSLDKNFVMDQVADGIRIWEGNLANTKNNPLYWMSVANLYFAESNFHPDSTTERKAMDAAARAVALAPKRVEPLLVQAKFLLMANDAKSAELDLDKILSLLPNETSPYAANNSSLIEIYDAVAQYYGNKADFSKVAVIYLRELKITPNDYQLYANLAATYAKLGEKEKAKEAAMMVMQLNPAAKNDVDQFLKSLQ